MDAQTAQALANLSASAMTTASLYEEQREQRDAAESARRQAVFLADATAILSRSLDYERTLRVIAQLAVPEIADWCAIDVVKPEGQLQRLAVAHIDPSKVEMTRTLEQKYPTDPDVPGGVHQVIRTGKPAMMTTIPRELIAASARDEEHRRVLDELSLTSYMCVPLVSAHGTFGAMTFVFAESRRHYTESDLPFAEDVASRAALAIDNAIAYQRASEANRLKDEFLATLSHELRTPLNAMLGYLQMLNAGILKGEQAANALAVTTRNANSLKQIIDDVLDVSRITSGKLHLNVRAIALSEILRSAVATVQPAADARGVAIHTVIDPDVPVVSGDADRLQQIVWNLLSNAVKFTSRGGHVDIRLQYAAAVEIVVKDDGKGIEPTFLPHIFERFRQADSRFAREHGGLGLGLAIVRELTELHGGTVTASSGGPGQGATFTVCLPAAAVDESLTESTVPRPSPPALTEPGMSGKLEGTRILAVDDEADALGLLRLVLEGAGAEVSTAPNAAHALELLGRARYDALIADIGMPGIDGLELIRRVRRSIPPPGNALPAAALTAYARSEDRVIALKSGYQVHIAKPVNPGELVTTIAGLLGR
jgi:signal transduction histidine kinase